MEALIGIVGQNFVLMAADRVAARSIVVMKGAEDKFRVLSPSMAMTYAGEPGDTVQFAEFIQRNIKLYAMRNEVELGTEAASHFIRRSLADSLRTKNAYQVNLLIGGTTEAEGPELFWIDHLSALTKAPFAAHGYAAHFVLSLLDRHYRPDLTVEEAIDLFKLCLAELKQRFIVNLPDFAVRIIKAGGIEEHVISI